MPAQETKPQHPHSAARRRLSPAALAVAAVLLVSWRVVVWQRQVRLNHALIRAVNKDDTLAAERLLDEGADPNTRDGFRSPASWPVRVWDKLRHRQPPPAVHGYPVLYAAIDNQDEKVVRSLITQGADVNAVTGEYQGVDMKSPLVDAERWDVNNPKFSVAVVRMLVARGANVNVKDAMGNPLLSNASNADEVQLLIKAGADVNARDSLGDTPLLAAVRFEFPDHANQPQINAIIQELLAAGADINARNNNNETGMMGETPLMLACHYGLTSTTRFLLRHGAQVNLRDAYGESALDFAVKSDFAQPKAKREIIAMLVQASKKQKGESNGNGRGKWMTTTS